MYVCKYECVSGDGPILSRKTSLSSLSAGLSVAMSMGLQGYLTEMPSRSTITKPSVIACSSIVVRSTSSRLMSSMYRMPAYSHTQ